MAKIKALVLLSGGLDSMLAARILLEQGIEVQGICFTSNFYGCAKAKKAAGILGIKLITVDQTEKMLDTAKNPPSGYGKNMNPCIDCHALMINQASEYLTPQPPLLMRGGRENLALASKLGERCHFIATGEVLGERPFSQNRQALAKVEKLAGVEVLRPLSAKLLPETSMEQQGLVKRRRLLDIAGRSRQRQLELVKKYRIKDFASPGGGCLLTDPAFSQRLIRLLANWPDCNPSDVELLKHGRVFWFREANKEISSVETAFAGDKIIMVIGRNKQDNEQLIKLARPGDIMVELKELMGPTSLIRCRNNNAAEWPKLEEMKIPAELIMSQLKLGQAKSRQEIMELAGLLTGYYATRAKGRKVGFKQKKK